MTPESTGTQDLRTIARIFWRWKVLFLAFVVLIPLGAYFVERGKPKIYQSSTLIELQNGASLGAPVASGNIQAVAQLVTTTPIAKRAALFLRPPSPNPGSLVGNVTASADTTTNFLTITARDNDPHRAAAIASAFASAIGSYQTTQAINSIDLQLSALGKQLAAIPTSDAASRTSVTSQIAQLRAQRGATGGGAQVLEPAVANSTPVGPKTRRAVELALVIALLLGTGAVLAAENTDRRLRKPEDLEELSGLPLLGVVPPTAFPARSYSLPRNEEAFQMLHAALTSFNVERPLSSIAIVSPLPADGKTTVAVGLAIATARAGKRTILVDADLRRPEVCTRLGITPTGGLSAVLSGQQELADVMIEHDVDAPAGGRLLVLPAGTVPPNPSALIGSKRMRKLLRQLETQADLVIIDTSAALAVGDALPLLQTASGIAVIVRMNRSSTAAVRRLLKVMESASGTAVGVVATGSSAVAGGYGNAYEYYYSAGDRDKGGWRRPLRWRRAHRHGRRPGPYRPSSNGNSHPEPVRSAASSEIPVGGATANGAAVADDTEVVVAPVHADQEPKEGTTRSTAGS